MNKLRMYHTNIIITLTCLSISGKKVRPNSPNEKFGTEFQANGLVFYE